MVAVDTLCDTLCEELQDRKTSRWALLLRTRAHVLRATSFLLTGGAYCTHTHTHKKGETPSTDRCVDAFCQSVSLLTRRLMFVHRKKFIEHLGRLTCRQRCSTRHRRQGRTMRNTARHRALFVPCSLARQLDKKCVLYLLVAPFPVLKKHSSVGLFCFSLWRNILPEGCRRRYSFASRASCLEC